MVWSLGFRIQFRFRVYVLGFMVNGSEFEVQGLGFKVENLADGKVEVVRCRSSSLRVVCVALCLSPRQVSPRRAVESGLEFKDLGFRIARLGYSI
jgi:hypothetical protein